MSINSVIFVFLNQIRSNFIRSFRFFLLYFFIFQTNSLFSKNNYSLSGLVFYDFNKNGIMDHDEFGIGGQYIILDKKTVSTSLDGKFSFSLDKPLDFITQKVNLEIDDTRFWESMVLTTPEKIILSSIGDSMFGIYYPIKVMMMNPLNDKKVQILSEFITPSFEMNGDLNAFYFTLNNTRLYIPKISLSLKKETRFRDFSNPSQIRIYIDSQNIDDVKSWEIKVADKNWKVVYKKRKDGQIPKTFIIESFSNKNMKDFHFVQLRALTSKFDLISSNFLRLPTKKILNKTFSINSRYLEKDNFLKDNHVKRNFSEFENINYLSNDFLLLITHEVNSTKNNDELQKAHLILKKLKLYAESKWGFSSKNILLKTKTNKTSNEKSVYFRLYNIEDKIKLNAEEHVIINGKKIPIIQRSFSYQVPDGTSENDIMIKTLDGRTLKTSIPLLNFKKRNKKKSYSKYTAENESLLETAQGKSSFLYTSKGKFKNIAKLYINDEPVDLSDDGRFEVPLSLFIGKNTFNFKVIDNLGFMYDFSQILTANIVGSDGTFLNLIVPDKIDFVSKWNIFIKGFTNPGSRLFYENREIEVSESGEFALIVNSYKTKQLELTLQSITGKTQNIYFNLLEILNIKTL